MAVGLSAGLLGNAQDPFETDTFPTSAGELKITFIGHGSLIFTFGGKVIHVDPYGKLTDYAKLPKADLILLTHEHADHLDPAAIKAIRQKDTVLVVPPVCVGRVEGGTVMKNGDRQTVLGVGIEAVPAYNVVHRRNDGQPYHPKGVGNGYVLTFGDQRVYVAGDTENIPEMAALTKINVAFLPVNLPYTMTPAMAAAAVQSFGPQIVYPYHYGDTDAEKMVAALKAVKNIEVRLRKMK